MDLTKAKNIICSLVQMIFENRGKIPRRSCLDPSGSSARDPEATGVSLGFSYVLVAGCKNLDFSPVLVVGGDAKRRPRMAFYKKRDAITASLKYFNNYSYYLLHFASLALRLFSLRLPRSSRPWL